MYIYIQTFIYVHQITYISDRFLSYVIKAYKIQLKRF